MKFVAEDQGRINEAVILHISTEVCFFENSMFSDMNATRNGFQCGSEVIDLKRVKFNIVKQENQFGLSAAEKPYYQAEVLVKTWIPIKYITNIDQF